MDSFFITRGTEKEGVSAEREGMNGNTARISSSELINALSVRNVKDSNNRSLVRK